MTRVLAEGARIAAIALVVTVALGTGQRTSILPNMALVLIYTLRRGMKAVTWTNARAICFVYFGSPCRIFSAAAPDTRRMGNDCPGSGLGAQVSNLRFFIQPDESGETLHVLVRLNWRHFFTMASHGNRSNHRAAASAAKSERESKPALLASGVIILLQFALFLVLGVMLYARHGAPAAMAGRSYDSVFPEFIVTAMPSGARGAILAAILAVAMSNASGSLNSLAASSVVDFQNMRGLRALEENPARLLRRSRWMTVVGNRARRSRHGWMGTHARSGIDHRRHYLWQASSDFFRFPFCFRERRLQGA